MREKIYTITGCKSADWTFIGRLADAVAAAEKLAEELQPAYGVTVSDGDGDVYCTEPDYDSRAR